MRTLTQKCRPQTIREVSGQEIAKICLTSLVKKPEEAPRVLLLHGPYGVGKTTLARAFARALNCKNPIDGDACGSCDNCRRNINELPYYDEYDSSIVGNIETIRQLRDTFDYNSDSGYRVITIDEAHLISKAAQSALLKVFEEVSTRVFFVLCTTEEDKLLSTIHSRSFPIGLTLIEDEDIKENLKKTTKLNNIDIDEQTLNMIITESRGHLRDAHILLQSYALMGKEAFVRANIDLRTQLIAMLMAAYQKNLKAFQKSILNIMKFTLSKIKIEYESLILDIMRVGVGASELGEADKLLLALLRDAKGKTLELYYILSDSIIFNSFTSDDRLQAAFYVIYQKINSKTR